MRPQVVVGAWTVTTLSLLGVVAARSFFDGDKTDGTASPVIAVHDWNGYPDAGISGRLTMVDECLLIGDEVAFWADGTSWDPTQRSVVFASAAPVQVGDEFSGGGGGYTREDLAGLDGLDVDSVYDCLDRTGADSAVIATPS